MKNIFTVFDKIRAKQILLYDIELKLKSIICKHFFVFIPFAIFQYKKSLLLAIPIRFRHISLASNGAA